MLRSMYAGVSGLRVHQTKMDVISNNIANINTVGFKKSSVSFKDSFSQTLSSASGANDVRGGINPQQIGLGSNVGSIVSVMTQGAAQRTDYASDLMIDGDGMFIIQDANGYGFTRSGVFEIDSVGNLVDVNGNMVCGWQTKDDPENPGQQIIVQDVVSPLNIYEGDKMYVPAEQTTAVQFDGNFNESTNPEQNSTITLYDTQGNKYTIDIRFSRYGLDGEGNIIYDDEGNPTILPANEWAVALPGTVTVNNGETMYWNELTLTGDAGTGATPSLTFNEYGICIASEWVLSGLDTTQIVTEDGAEFSIGGIFDFNGVDGAGVTLDFSGTTQFNSGVTVTSQTLDGNTAGAMTGYSIDASGIIAGTYSNGQTKLLGQLALANFNNPAGLEKSGSNIFRETRNSSQFDGVGFESSALGSTIQSGALEMSNVDLAAEFSDMIVTQRGFQANSRIITTSDEIITELVNLKR